MLNSVSRSFNYGTSDDYHHLASQYYAICFRKRTLTTSSSSQ